LCTLGLFGIGWIYDLWLLLIMPNKPITESYQYNIYLKVVEALQKKGYTVKEYERKWCIIMATVVGHDFVSTIFVVADPKPGFVSYMIGGIFPKYENHRYEMTEYGAWRRRLKLSNSDHYWPEGNLVAGFWQTGSNECLNVLKSIIG